MLEKIGGNVPKTERQDVEKRRIRGERRETGEKKKRLKEKRKKGDNAQDAV